MEINNTNLCGSIYSNNKESEKFLAQLESLMEKYAINKIDVAWEKYDG